MTIRNFQEGTPPRLAMKKYNGVMAVGTLVFYLLSILLPPVKIVAILLAWMVPVLMWRSLGRSSLQQALTLLLIGFAAIIFSASQGVFLGWERIFSVNLPLLAMFVAVAFLSLTNPDLENPDLPKGNRAVVTTAFGTHLLGAVINLSVIFVFGDRLQKNGALSREQMIILARSFCAAAWWSPFFIATGVALTYAPGMQWRETLIPGSVMSIIAISYSCLEACYGKKTQFYGYPLQFESMTVPVFLATLVIFMHHFRHDISVLLLICMLSPGGALLFMKGRPRTATVHDFIKNRIVSVNSQFALFLAAGVFSTGISSVTQVYPALFSLESLTFSPLLFATLLAAMIFIGILGVHPIVSIAIVSPLLIPLKPDPSQLGFLFLSSWAISTACSPLSGIGLALVSRYQVSPREILRSNWHYALIMCAFASVMNVLFFAG
ncbi:MAG: hypothetical protein ACWGOX_01940 [Desulforhopalus sp.]